MVVFYIAIVFRLCVCRFIRFSPNWIGSPSPPCWSCWRWKWYRTTFKRRDKHAMKTLREGRTFPWTRAAANPFLNAYNYSFPNYLIFLGCNLTLSTHMTILDCYLYNNIDICSTGVTERFHRPQLSFFFFFKFINYWYARTGNNCVSQSVEHYSCMKSEN